MRSPGEPFYRMFLSLSIICCWNIGKMKSKPSKFWQFTKIDMPAYFRCWKFHSGMNMRITLHFPIYTSLNYQVWSETQISSESGNSLQRKRNLFSYPKIVMESRKTPLSALTLYFLMWQICLGELNFTDLHQLQYNLHQSLVNFNSGISSIV